MFEKIKECKDAANIAFDYVRQASDKGDKNSILFLAKAYDTGSESELYSKKLEQKSFRTF